MLPCVLIVRSHSRLPLDAPRPQLQPLDSLSRLLRPSFLPNLSTFKPSDLPTFLDGTILVHPKSFRINTCKSVSKQTTLTPFRITTYEKPRGRGYISSSPCPPCSDLSALCVKPLPAFADVPNCPLHDYRGMEENWIPRRASQSPQSTQPAGKGLSQTEWHSVQDQRMTS